MTNNTIPNVPRELLERLHSYIPNGDGHNSQYANDLADAVVALEGFAAPSPAGVDGLEVVGYVSQDDIKWQGDCTLRIKPYSDYTTQLCRLSDAQAIIDGLRGEVGAQRVKTCAALKARNDAHEERDQQAQRIGELEGLLLDFAYHTQRREMPTESSLAEWADRIDAALSAGKDSAS